MNDTYTIYKMYASERAAQKFISQNFPNRTDFKILEICGNFYVVCE